ncbi:MAG: hypothetical protein BWY95_01478 [Bacteroidetes bacterium ADurb.BinA104]|nr:MAG: hypothetical protein BWY95_01478 [Bacteroidetes bacterium ADurb.BinA104]
MVKFVTYYIIVAPHKTGNRSHIGLKTGREDHSLFFSDKFGQLGLKFVMQVERTVQITRTGTTGTVLFNSLYRGFNNLGMVGKSQI